VTDADVMICDQCLDLVKGRMTDDDWKVLLAIYRSGPMNRDRIMNVSRLSTSRMRESVLRLYGACLVNIKKYGTHRIISLTVSGEHLCRSIESQYKKDKGGP
jgi:hypothetical protein